MAPVAIKEVLAVSSEVPVCSGPSDCDSLMIFSKPHVAANVLNTDKHKTWRAHAGEKCSIVLQVRVIGFLSVGR